MKTIRARRLATLSALIAIAGVTSLTGTALAQPDNLIPPEAKGSLSVHKFAQPVNYGPESQGMELPAQATAGLTPLAGATFQIAQVSNINLAQNSGWADAQRAVDAFDPFAPAASLTSGGFQLKNPASLSTNSAGLARFTNLPVGLYLVEETQAPPAGTNQTVSKAMPFLITVPLTDPTGLTRWVYDVHAYPKNVISSVTKSVNDANTVSAGQTIDYTIKSDIPGGAVTTKYVVTDQLDSRLDYKSTKVNIGSTSVSDFTATHSNGLVTVTLGGTARAQAYTALQSDNKAQVSVTHTVQVKASGEIKNDAKLTFQRAGEWETEVPSPLIETKFGGINVFKHTSDSLPLANAVFEVWSSHQDDFKTATQVTVNGKKEWTTDAQGKTAVDGLRYSGFADGATVAKGSGKYNFYWLVEAKAPNGYELLAEPIPFTVESALASANVINVANTPHNAGGMLPATGAGGTTVFLLVGAVLVAGGTGATLLARSRGARRGTDR